MPKIIFLLTMSHIFHIFYIKFVTAYMRCKKVFAASTIFNICPCGSFSFPLYQHDQQAKKLISQAGT